MSAADRVQYLRTVVPQHYCNDDSDNPVENTDLSFQQWLQLPMHTDKSLPQLLDIYSCLLRGFAQDILNAIWEHVDTNRNGVAEASEVEAFVFTNFTSQAAEEQHKIFRDMIVGAGSEACLDRKRLVDFVATCAPKTLREMYGQLLQSKGVLQLEPEFTDEELDQVKRLNDTVHCDDMQSKS